METDRFQKRREDGERKICTPALCSDCKHIGGGDFVCQRTPGILVISDWRPTVNYLQCREPHDYRRNRTFPKEPGHYAPAFSLRNIRLNRKKCPISEGRTAPCQELKPQDVSVFESRAQYLSKRQTTICG